MIDIVIPLGKESEWENNELRYSLRSFDKFLTGIGKIFIVGDEPPAFLQRSKVAYIPFPDQWKVKERNTTAKVIEACRDKRVSTNFLLSNDDFFLLKSFNANEFPYYHRGDLLFHINKLHPHSVYASCRRNTYIALAKNGFQTKSFELHCPIRYNKDQFLKSISLFKSDSTLLPRSLYCNFLQIEGKKKGDYIINLPLNPGPIEKNSFFTIRDGPVNGEMESFFESLYPQKSKWE